MKNARFLLGCSLVVLATVLRIVPHLWNLTPVGAVSLFAGATFDRRRWAFAIPLGAMFLGDTLLELLTGHGYHSLMPVVYATFAVIVCFGMVLRSRRRSPLAVGSGAVASATLFFIVTNFAMWTISTIYPHTFAGLVACYIGGIPYYGTMLIGDVVFSALLFGTFVCIEHRVPRFAER